MSNHAPSNTSLSPLGRAAQEYAANGLQVFPLFGIKDGRCECGNLNCSSPGKHPRIKGGLTSATGNTTEISMLWSKWPDSNIGVNTQNLVVIDVDGEEGRSSAQSIGLSEVRTPTVTTGNGQHFYFRRTAECSQLKTRSGVMPGIDLRTNGGYSIAPPSNHVNGTQYSFENGLSFSDVSFAKVPRQVASLLAKGKKETKEEERS